VAALHAAALNRRKRSAEAAGLGSSPLAADAAAAAASPCIPGSSSHHQQHPPGDADDKGAQLSPAAAQLMRALGLPSDSEKAALTEHIRELLRKRGATSETQVRQLVQQPSCK
jgi:nitrous oxide reductase